HHDRRARRERVAEVAPVLLAHGRRVGALLQIHRGLDHVVQRRARRFQDGGDVAQRPGGLLADVAHLARLAIATSLAGPKDKIADSDGLVERSGRRWRLVGADRTSLSHTAPTLSRCAMRSRSTSVRWSNIA